MPGTERVPEAVVRLVSFPAREEAPRRVLARAYWYRTGMRVAVASVWVLALLCGAGLGCGSSAGGSHGDAAQRLDAPTSSGGSGGMGGTGGTGGAGGADASIRDSFGDGADGTDAADAADAAIFGTRDAADVGGASDTAWDGPPPGGPLCGAETDHGVLTSSAVCKVAPLDATPVCQGAGPCPFGATAYQLTCGGYGPWIVPAGSDGASILFADASGPTHLFSLAPGGAKVEDVPALASAANALAVDPTTGDRTIFAGEMPGIWRVRETAAGWRREAVVEGNGPNLALVSAKVLVSAARVLDADRAIVAYFGLSDYQPRLAIREAGCWRTTALSEGETPTDLSLDLDATNRPWTAWYERDTSGMMVRMAGPDSKAYVAWQSPAAYSPLGWSDPPILLAGGLAGTAAYPAIVIQRDDGVHVLVPDATAAGWTDGILDGTAIAQTPGCLAPISVAPATGCDTTVHCTTQTAGSIRGFAAARVASGRTYVAWVAIEGQTTFGYRPQDPLFCETPTHPAKCGCDVTSTTSNTMSLVLTRADTGVEAMRFALDSGRAGIYAPLGLAARGNTLLLAVSAPNASTAEYRYLEIDTTRLPK
jgi:hypothetical protein